MTLANRAHARWLLYSLGYKKIFFSSTKVIHSLDFLIAEKLLSAPQNNNNYWDYLILTDNKYDCFLFNTNIIFTNYSFFHCLLEKHCASLISVFN